MLPSYYTGGEACCLGGGCSRGGVFVTGPVVVAFFFFRMTLPVFTVFLGFGPVEARDAHGLAQRPARRVRLV